MLSDLMPTGKYHIIQERREEVCYHRVILFICSKVLLCQELTLLLTAIETLPLLPFTTCMYPVKVGQVVARAASEEFKFR